MVRVVRLPLSFPTIRNNYKMEKLKVLFVDDDIDFGKLMHMGLTKLGYEVHFQTSLSGIEECITQFFPEIIVLDVEIGNENGIEKASEIIQKFPSIPIIFVSSHTDIDTITNGLSVGGVNYLKKPIDIRELDAYIKRFAIKHQNSNIINLKNYSLNTDTQELFYGEEMVKKLSPLERNALLLFWENKNLVVSNDVLSITLWGKEYTPELDSSLYNLISKLRKTVNRDEKLWVTTIKGIGYQLTVI